MNPPPRRRPNPRKLLLSKWTAVTPRHKETHFLVSKVYEPVLPSTGIEKMSLKPPIPGVWNILQLDRQSWPDLTTEYHGT